jgi:adenine-specific DNA-methyltransferase
MTENFNERLKLGIQEALKQFAQGSLFNAATGLLGALGYRSGKTIDARNEAPETFIDLLNLRGKLNSEKAFEKQWSSASFLFQLTNDEIPSLASGQMALDIDSSFRNSQIESFLFIAIELKGNEWNRTDLAEITRELNKCFLMPTIVLFKYGGFISLAVIDRRPNLRDSTLDVIKSRISAIKDVQYKMPHRAHIEILADLAIQKLFTEKHPPTNFRELYDAWMKVLSIEVLNKNFYRDLSDWYFWAVTQVDFPLGGGLDREERNSIAVIRLLTRLIFIWFIKEKRLDGAESLIPEALFEPSSLADILKDSPRDYPKKSNYYLAILQNLFFATLNNEMGESRTWRQEGYPNEHYLISYAYRHKELFIDPDDALKWFAGIPFLNGGLFESLDRQVTDLDLKRHPHLKNLVAKEGSGLVLRIDGFSRIKAAQPNVPNEIFFGSNIDFDVNEARGTKGSKDKVNGLIPIFNKYKFTVEENTPLSEEVALDPELLGKVFENLLASYNPDTKTTARKLSGSFYTPREVVDYMVDEALILYFSQSLTQAAFEVEEDSLSMEERLHSLVGYSSSKDHHFSNQEVEHLISAIESLKILDPACGSGAFPMGMLQKLVYVLSKLDPDNTLWRTRNRLPLEERLESVRKKILDPQMREDQIEQAEEALRKFDRDFSEDTNYRDYSRKLYLIEKCIYGVDIQPIAVQISKLRFFISLVVSQKVIKERDNWNITSLPNLETKIIAANTLIFIERPESIGGVQTSLLAPSIKAKEEELQEANRRHFAARTTLQKRKIRANITDLREELIVLLQQDSVLSSDIVDKIAYWDAFDQNTSADFLDSEWMFGLEHGFNIVIGNPPYIHSGNIGKSKPRLRALYNDFFDGNADLYTYFYCRGFNLLKPDGILAYISSNKFMRAGYGLNTRKLLTKSTRLYKVIDFGELPVFGASVDTAIVIAGNPSNISSVNIFQAVMLKEKAEIPVAGSVLKQRGESYSTGDLPDYGWLFVEAHTRERLTQVQKTGKQLSKIVGKNLYSGIKVGLLAAFVIDKDHRDRFLEEQPELINLLKPWLDGNEILRWRANYSEQYLIAIASSNNYIWPWSNARDEHQAELLFAKTYPVLYEHFLPFVDNLKYRGDKGKYWWELRSCSYWDAFNKSPKIIYNETSKNFHAFIDNQKFCLNNTGFFLLNEELYYLLGILTSAVLDFYYRYTLLAWGDPWNGGRIRFFKERMIDVPIPWPNTLKRNIITECVRVISTIYNFVKIDNFVANRFERLLNGLVYELFFPDDLHARKLFLFNEVEKEGLLKLDSLSGDELQEAGGELAERIFSPSHPIYGMLHDLQGLDVVRIIEGRD